MRETRSFLREIRVVKVGLRVPAASDSVQFADCAPPTICATLLDEGVYLGSVRTKCRLLASDGQLRERRHQLTHPAYTRPEPLATGPNEVWSWDITKIKGSIKWICFHLYVILDLFSRYEVGWMIAPDKGAELAEQLIADTLAKEGIAPGTLTLHADRGTRMRFKVMAQLLCISRSASPPTALMSLTTIPSRRRSSRR